MSKKFAVIGAGGWGTATGGILAEKGFEVVLVGNDAAYIAKMKRRRMNPTFLPGYRFPAGLELTTDGLAAVESADCVLSVIPTRAVRTTWKELGPRLPSRVPVISLTKGIENKTFERPSQIIRSFAPGHSVAVLSGPSHAEEVAKKLPTTVTIASANQKLSRELQADFGTETFRVYTNSDVLGVEVGGAMKNVIAIAGGILDGLGFGDNTKAALLTRGLAEIANFGVALGAKRKTFYGMAGVGDLITTAFSPFGRNRAVGEKIGKGMKLDDILAQTQMVAEGVGTTRSVYHLARRLEIEMPIATEVYRVLFRNKDPMKAVTTLMTRKGKGE